MANLYELSSNYQQLLDLFQTVDTTDTEYEQALNDTLESINDAIDVKAEGYAMVANQLKADIDVVETEIARLTRKKIAFKNNLEKLKESLFESMKQTGKEKIKTPRFSIWIQNNPASLEVLNDEEIPKEYLIEQKPKIDKRTILKDMKEGKEVKGVVIKQTEGVRFR